MSLAWWGSRGYAVELKKGVVELAAQLRSANPHVGNPDLRSTVCGGVRRFLTDGRQWEVEPCQKAARIVTLHALNMRELHG